MSVLDILFLAIRASWFWKKWIALARATYESFWGVSIRGKTCAGSWDFMFACVSEAYKIHRPTGVWPWRNGWSRVDVWVCVCVCLCVCVWVCDCRRLSLVVREDAYSLMLLLDIRARDVFLQRHTASLIIGLHARETCHSPVVAEGNRRACLKWKSSWIRLCST